MKRHKTHKYHRIQLDFGRVWACALSDCTHYMPKHMENLVEGKQSFCWNCNEIFILDSISMKDDKPICINCRVGRPEPEDKIDADNPLLKYLEKLEV